MTKTVHFTLPDELEIAIDAAVAKGEFQSADDLILAAVERWRADSLIDEIGVETVRRLWDEGIASGPGRDRSIDDVISQARRQAVRS